MKKIAIPVRDEFVNEHFGHSDTFIVYSITEQNKIESSEQVHADEGCGCRSGIADVLARKGVSVMLAGNIGAGAIHHLSQSGIAVVRGCTGKSDEIMQDFLSGSIHDNHQTCQHHGECDDHHSHGHSH